MTFLELQAKINSILTTFPLSKYTIAGKGIIYIFTDGVLKQSDYADIQIDVVKNKMWLLEGVSL